MRQPGRPRKPLRLPTPHAAPHNAVSGDGSSDGGFGSAAPIAGGGEIVRRPSSSVQDSVPTAPAPPPEDWDQWLEETREATAGPVAPAELSSETVHDWESPEASASLARESWAELDKSLFAKIGTTFSDTASKMRESLTEWRKKRSAAASDDISARLAERRQENRKVRLRRVGIFGAVVSALALVAWVFVGSPIFRYSYEPQDIAGYSENSIVNRAQLEAAVAALDGRQLVTLNEAEVAGEIIGQIPEIASVSVKKEYPSSLAITITEEIPVACLGQDACAAVSASGKAITVPDEIAQTLPRIGEIGSALNREQALKQALEVLTVLSPTTRQSVQSISIANGSLISLQLTEGRSVYWGTVDRPEFKAKVLDALLTQPVNHIDVSVPNAPVSH